MLVGAPLSGKTTVYRILADAMNLVAYREGDSDNAEPIRIQVPGDEGADKEGKAAKEATKEPMWQGVDIKVSPFSLTFLTFC